MPIRSHRQYAASLGSRVIFFVNLKQSTAALAVSKFIRTPEMLTFPNFRHLKTGFLDIFTMLIQKIPEIAAPKHA